MREFVMEGDRRWREDLVGRSVEERVNVPHPLPVLAATTTGMIAVNYPRTWGFDILPRSAASFLNEFAIKKTKLLRRFFCYGVFESMMIAVSLSTSPSRSFDQWDD